MVSDPGGRHLIVIEVELLFSADVITGLPLGTEMIKGTLLALTLLS